MLPLQLKYSNYMSHQFVDDTGFLLLLQYKIQVKNLLKKYVLKQPSTEISLLICEGD